MRIVPNMPLFGVKVFTAKVEIHNPKACFQLSIPSLRLRTSFSLLSILIASLLVAMTLHSPTAFANPLIDVSLNDEQYLQVYDFLDRMAAKKVIGGILKNSRPYSRGEVATALAALDKRLASGDVKLSRIERKRLAHLMRIFAVDLSAPLAPACEVTDAWRFAGLTAYPHADRYDYQNDWGSLDRLPVSD